MAPILTITLNPTIDIASEADLVRPTHKVRTFDERYDPGGGGINVARVVAELGGETEALFLAGCATGALLDDFLDRARIPRRLFQIAEPTRISFTVHERTRISLRRFRAYGQPGGARDVLLLPARHRKRVVGGERQPATRRAA